MGKFYWRLEAACIFPIIQFHYDRAVVNIFSISLQELGNWEILLEKVTGNFPISQFYFDRAMGMGNILIFHFLTGIQKWGKFIGGNIE